MKIKTDNDAFDELQMELTYAIALEVKDILTEAGLTDEKLRQVTEQIVLEVTGIFDSGEMEMDEKTLVPFLTFASGEEEPELIVAEGGSNMQDYAIDMVEEAFSEGDDDDQPADEK